MSLNNETTVGQDTTVAIENSIKGVREAFIRKGDDSIGKCLEGCVGLVYSLIERGQASLFRYLFLLHGHQFLGEPVAGSFRDHYTVVGEDQQGRWFAASPANFDNQSSSEVEILQAMSPEDLYRQIKRQVGGYWVNPGSISADFYSNGYLIPKVITEGSQPKVAITVGEWDSEGSGFSTAVYPVDLFIQRTCIGRSLVHN